MAKLEEKRREEDRARIDAIRKKKGKEDEVVDVE